MEQSIPLSPYDDGQPFITAAIRTVSYQKLVQLDAAEQAKLLECGQNDGFFYLDLTQPESEGLWDDYKQVLAAMAEFFDQPEAKKLSYAYGSDVQGYVAICASTSPFRKCTDSMYRQVQTTWYTNRRNSKLQRRLRDHPYFDAWS